MARSKMFGLLWFPIAKQSLKPFVTTMAMSSPFLSSKALVATVVPILILSIFEVSNGSPRTISLPVNLERRRRIPSRGASS